MDINVTVAGEIDLNAELDTNRRNDDGDGFMRETLADRVAAEYVRKLFRDDEWNTARERIRTIRDAEIRTHVQKEIETALSGEINLTNSYGESTGKKTTLRELIVKQAEQILTQPLDRYHSDRKETALGKFIREAVDGALKKELAAALIEEKAKAKAVVQAKAAELIAQVITEGLGR